MTRILPHVLLTAASLCLTVPPVQGASASSSTAKSKATFHKGWKRRDTPYKPQWGPSLCGGSGNKNTSDTPRKTKTKVLRAKKNSQQFLLRGSQKIQPNAYPRGESPEMDKMKEIHAAQMYLVQNGENLTSEQREAKIREIRNAYPMVADTIAQTGDFPFPSQPWNMASILKGIRKKQIKSEFSAKGKSDEQLLQEIQNKQLDCFKRTLDSRRR